ncbi:MAG: RluA family pseudouridine synthase [Bacteroidales bacterium]|nr:RluA family pseudouridine synthase [Bacteroidales bacterium]
MKYTVKNTANLLDTVLEMYHGISRQKAKQIISKSYFFKNGSRLANHPLEALNTGDILEQTNIDRGMKPVKMANRARPFSIYFEDDHLIAAFKPAGILSSFDRNRPKDNSFQKELQFYLNQRGEETIRLWVIHQIDREVEGIMLFAFSEDIQAKMIEQWHDSQIRYLALTENKPFEKQGVIENWLHENAQRKLVATPKEVANSKFAKTSFEYLKRYGENHLLELNIHHGRSKQIRAHLSDLDCPVVGDRKYGADTLVLRQIRLALHSLEFKHPVKGNLISLKYQPAAKFFNPSTTENELYKIL